MQSISFLKKNLILVRVQTSLQKVYATILAKRRREKTGKKHLFLTCESLKQTSDEVHGPFQISATALSC